MKSIAEVESVDDDAGSERLIRFYLEEDGYVAISINNKAGSQWDTFSIKKAEFYSALHLLFPGLLSGEFPDVNDD